MIFKNRKLWGLVALLGCLSQHASAECLDQDFDLPFTLYRQGNPPPNDTSNTYRHFPGDAYFTGAQSVHNIPGSQTSADKFLFLWVNRCQFASSGQVCGHNQTGNPPYVQDAGNNYAFYFTSLNRADACTRSQLYYALGAENFSVNVLGRYGVSHILPSQDPLNYRNYSGGFRDVCYLYAENLEDDVDGVVFDYEPQDNRSAYRTNLISDYFSRFLRDPNRFTPKLMYMWTNPLISPYNPATANGIIHNTNANYLLNLYDMVSILSFHQPNPVLIQYDLQAQAQVWGAVSPADLQRIYSIVPLGQLNASQILAHRSAAINGGYGAAAIWGNLPPGGTFGCDTDYRDRVECFVHGSCSGF